MAGGLDWRKDPIPYDKLIVVKDLNGIIYMGHLDMVEDRFYSDSDAPFSKSHIKCWLPIPA